ncbi:Ceramide synthase 5 [Phlyctochytrium bullatum]|nr:Ceramide synthase 5 [Phlyctochytrium bullatum]
MSNDMKVYYQASFGSCAYMLVSIFLEPRQKDFPAMLTHHIFCSALVTASYFLGFHRIGSVILLLHDVADPLMEAAKLCVYTGRQGWADALFAVFAGTFVVTRNGVYPYVIAAVPRFAWHADGRVMPYGRWEVFGGCLACLGVLVSVQFYWGSLIVRMAIKAFVDKKVEGDIRDEDE